jgi:predicted transcriptional regulator of viral defense system
MDLDLSRVHHRRSLVAAGYTDRELSRLRRGGVLATIRRGSYLVKPDVRLDDPAARHGLLIAAAWPRFAEGSVVSHCSAAVLFGLPTWAVPLDRVHLTRARRGGGRIGSVAHLHSAPLDAHEVVEVAGFPVTSPARTVVDLARVLPFETAVVIVDAALHAGLVDGECLAAALGQAARWRGSARARRAVAFADGRSESVGESRSRVAMSRCDLLAPVPQWEVRRDGVLLGRVDFGWPDHGTVGEFDGRIKYGRLLRPGQDIGDAVFDEKLREDRLRAEGLRVVRWTWDDLADFDPVAIRLRRAFRTP